MKTRITKLFITLAVAVLAAAGPAWLQPVEAQMGDGSVRFISYASIGIVPGERVRLSVGNPEESGGTLALSFSYYMAHASNSWNNVPIYESGWMRVAQRESRFSEFAREDLGIEGEPKTGRAQLLVGVTMLAPAGSNPEDFPISLEIIKDEGQANNSVETDSKYRLIILAAKRSKQIAPISFLPGESLRYTFFNPNEEGSKTVRVTSYTYDSYGNLMRQTDPVELKPGQGHTFDLQRDELPVPGEDKTGRLQVRTSIQVAPIDNSAQPVKLHVSVEAVNRAGGTDSGTYFTGSVTVSGDG